MADNGEIKKSQPLEDFEPQGKSINDFIETAAERTYRLKKQQAKVKPKNESMSRERKHFLFINPGTEKIELLRYALVRNQRLPKWCEQGNFAKRFQMKGKKLFFEELEVLTTEQKRKLVKDSYFNPEKPSTIEKIYLFYRDKYANMSKRNVRDILNSIETYQLNHRRQRPPKVLGKMNLTAPGVIAADIFFPTKLLWDTAPCLCVMDCWSRFSRVYVLERKTKAMTLKAFDKFFKEFMSMGHRPKVLLTDKGSEFVGLANSDLFKKWKLEVHHSPTGTPVHIVESLQSQYMRRAEIYRTSSITNDVGHLMHLISNQLNMQPRRQFQNKTPLQLLSLNKSMRKEANAYNLEHRSYQETTVSNLPVLVEDNRVRFLTWTRKEQAANSMKGYSEKWSRSIHTVRKMIRIDKNKDVFKYYISDMPHYFWRHELLKITGEVDNKVPKLFPLVDKKLYENAVPKKKKKKIVPKVDKTIKLDVDQSNIIKRPRRKKKVNYAQFY